MSVCHSSGRTLEMVIYPSLANLVPVVGRAHPQLTAVLRTSGAGPLGPTRDAVPPSMAQEPTGEGAEDMSGRGRGGRHLLDLTQRTQSRSPCS